MSLVIAVIIVVFKSINDQSVISALFKAAGFTYGPLLGLYAFGFTTKNKVEEIMVPFIAVLSPVVMFVLNLYSEKLFWGYTMGFEVLIYNGLLTYLLLLIVSKSNSVQNETLD